MCRNNLHPQLVLSWEGPNCRLGLRPPVTAAAQLAYQHASNTPPARFDSWGTTAGQSDGHQTRHKVVPLSLPPRVIDYGPQRHHSDLQCRGNVDCRPTPRVRDGEVLLPARWSWRILADCVGPKSERKSCPALLLSQRVTITCCTFKQLMNVNIFSTVAV